MRAVLVDSNVLLDIATGDPRWAVWSSAALARAADEAPLVRRDPNTPSQSRREATTTSALPGRSAVTSPPSTASPPLRDRIRGVLDRLGLVLGEGTRAVEGGAVLAASVRLSVTSLRIRLASGSARWRRQPEEEGARSGTGPASTPIASAAISSAAESTGPPAGWILSRRNGCPPIFDTTLQPSWWEYYRATRRLSHPAARAVERRVMGAAGSRARETAGGSSDLSPTSRCSPARSGRACGLRCGSTRRS